MVSSLNGDCHIGLILSLVRSLRPLTWHRAGIGQTAWEDGHVWWGKLTVDPP
jgi:hypothetical protein